MPMKRLTALLLLVLSVYVVDAQTMMRDVIVSMPDSILPLLTKVNREDCVDFREANMQAQVTNRLGAITELTELTSDFASWRYTEGSVYEMKLLPLSDTLQVLCMTHRLLEPVCDASVRFFDSQWNLLPMERFIALPAASDDMSLLTTYDFALSPSSTELNVTTRCEYFDTESVVGADMGIYVKHQPYLYQWTDGRFTIAE